VVEDVLDVARVQGGVTQAAVLHDASRFIQSICHDWVTQNKAQNMAVALIDNASSAIEFEADHLRRVLVNLLDNALRHASRRQAAIQVSFQQSSVQGLWQLSVWSDGLPLDPGVQRHLFEPFFSSQSRSSGLGLYICRELCVRHGATIRYQRSSRLQPTTGSESPQEGNDFIVLLRPSLEATQPMPLMPWGQMSGRA
jgi:two-component system, NtrC family, sensor histidine kinase PilS